MSVVKIDKLPNSSYDGYYWMSDADTPVVFLGNINEDNLPDVLKNLNPEVNPYILEAQLFDKKNKISYGIKYIDGDYIVNRHIVTENIADIMDEKVDFITLKKYYGSRMENLKLLFLQYWEEKPDCLCESFPVLQPADMAFVGFER